ncbi:MAG TPA: DUF4923 family protein [Bacteroidales bacterium]|nr:DUF4923 family protein [Bacteroidales bacterium]
MKEKTTLLRNLIIILLAGALITSCKKDEDKEDDLIGTWNTTTATFDATIDDKPVLQYFVDMGLSEADAQTAVGVFNTSLQSSFTGTITFRSDNTYTSNLGGQSDNGTWNLNAGRDKLTIDSATDDPFTLDVQTLTNSKMVLSWTEIGQEDLNDDNVPENISVDVTMNFEK